MTYPLTLWQVVRGNWVPLAWANVGNPSGRTHHLEVVTSGLSIEVWWDGVRSIEYRSAFAADGTKAGFKWFPTFDWTSAFDSFAVVGSPRCVGTLSSSIVTPQYSGISGTVTVSAPPGCAWSVESDATWITFPSTTVGTGNGSVQFNIAPNSASAWR